MAYRIDHADHGVGYTGPYLGAVVPYRLCIVHCDVEKGTLR